MIVKMTSKRQVTFPKLVVEKLRIDTSVFVRLLTGHPEQDFQKTAVALKKLHEKAPSTELVVSNQVISEAYITLQHHYSISKEDALDSDPAVVQYGIHLPPERVERP